MRYLETKHKRNSAKITSLITIILLLLLFVVGLPFMDPPLEYGVAVNFGNSNVGSGTKPKAIPVKAPTKKVLDKVKPQPSEPKEVKETSKTEDVITDDTAQSIAIKKQKKAEAKARAEAERIEREQKEAEEQRLREEAEKAKKMDQINKMIGGVKNSESTDNEGEGPDSSTGNKGNP